MPAPAKLSARTTVWDMNAIDAWLDAKAAGANPAHAKGAA
ncbi:putative DNA-binding transcriptional regulator AlpA [Rhizobacter sp. SG703]|nr:putative DNA-binding transcriptional regulator AlpA [Rhizobacter sp. SG703]